MTNIHNLGVPDTEYAKLIVLRQRLAEASWTRLNLFKSVKQFSKGDITIMRESFNFKGFKRKVDTIAEADQLVLSYHPSWNGIREGSLGHWTWYLVDEIIAEAWLHQKSGWWLKIKIVDIS